MFCPGRLTGPPLIEILVRAKRGCAISHSPLGKFCDFGDISSVFYHENRKIFNAPKTVRKWTFLLRVCDHFGGCAITHFWREPEFQLAVALQLAIGGKKKQSSPVSAAVLVCLGASASRRPSTPLPSAMGGDEPSPEEADNDPITALRTAGNNALREGKNDDAITAYTEAIKSAPKDHRLYSNRAAAYSKLDKVRQSNPLIHSPPFPCLVSITQPQWPRDPDIRGLPALPALPAAAAAAAAAPVGSAGVCLGLGLTSGLGVCSTRRRLLTLRSASSSTPPSPKATPARLSPSSPRGCASFSPLPPWAFLAFLAFFAISFCFPPIVVPLLISPLISALPFRSVLLHVFAGTPRPSSPARPASRLTLKMRHSSK